MPTPKKYASVADRQAAYRRRCAGQGNPAAIPAMPGYRRWKAMTKQCLRILETAITEMDVYLDQRSDVWRDSERGEAFAEVMESITEIAAALRDIDFK